MSSTHSPSPGDLISVSRRERQILDVVYRLGSATAAEIHREIEDAPTYTTVRGLLRVLVGKGQLRIARSAGRYVYSPVVSKQAAGATMISHVVRTFFAGSASQAMSALLGSTEIEFSDEDLRRLQSLIDTGDARKNAV